MGFGLTWELTLPSNLPRDEVSERLHDLRERCMGLPFERVGELRILHGEELRRQRAETYIRGDFHFNVVVDGVGRAKPAPPGDYSGPLVTAEALEEVGFVIRPGRGCETANFVLARLPDSIFWLSPGQGPDRPQEIAVPRHEGRWYGFSGCKTMYAADPSCGGLDHFIKCHLGLIAALGEAESLGFGVTVTDSGGYWQTHELPRLLGELHRWNQVVAQVVGPIKDAFEERGDGIVRAPITERPDFEHLEAGGGGAGTVDVRNPVVADLLRRTGAKGVSLPGDSSTTE